MNLGYLARVMSNFGMKQLVVVSAKALTENQLHEARIFASHGKSLIDEIQFVPSLDRLRKKYQLLIGTTAIEGMRNANLTRKTLDVEGCISRVAERITSHPNTTCIVFGRDTTGLTNKELRCCDYNMTIRASREYNTLNLSHAAAIIFFILSKHLAEHQVQTRKIESSRKERERTVLLYEQLAKVSEFQNFKSGLLKETVSRLLDRSDPSLREIYLLMGLASKATSKIRRLTNRLP